MQNANWKTKFVTGKQSLNTQYTERQTKGTRGFGAKLDRATENYGSQKIEKLIYKNFMQN